MYEFSFFYTLWGLFLQYFPTILFKKCSGHTSCKRVLLCYCCLLFPLSLEVIKRKVLISLLVMSKLFEGCGTPTTFWNASLETLIGETRHIFGLATAMVQFTLVVPFKERAHALCKQRCCAHLQYILT